MSIADYLFPALNALPIDKQKAFLEQKEYSFFVANLPVPQKNESRFSTLWGGSSSETQEALIKEWSKYPLQKQCMHRYYGLLLEHEDIPFEQFETVSQTIKPLEQAYVALKQYQQNRMEAYYQRVKPQEQHLRMLRQKICLSQLGPEVKAKEVQRICEQYPVLKPIQQQLLRTDYDKLQETIKNYFKSEVDWFFQIPITSLFNSTESQQVNFHHETEKLAQALADSVIQDKPELFEEQSKDYEKHVETKVQTILSSLTIQDEQLSQYMRGLWSDWMSKFYEEADKLSDALLFLQYCGFYVGSDSNYFFAASIYAAHRNKEKFAHLKNVLMGLIWPLYPIWKEYESIGLYETNQIRKVARFLTPILIVAATVILALAAFALIPIGLPQVAFIAVLIPSLVVGLALASLYCKFKDSLHQNLRQAVYGGQYQLPEFRVNSQMNATFGQTQAKNVRSVYVSEIQKCQRQ